MIQIASRSTRNRIRLQAERAANMIVRAQEHLAKLDAIQDGRSPHIEKNLPPIVEITENLLRIILKFRDEC